MTSNLSGNSEILESVVYPLDGTAVINLPPEAPHELRNSIGILKNMRYAEPLFRSISRDILSEFLVGNKNGIIDIGCWKSDNSLPWASNWPKSQVFALDPSPINIAAGELVADFNELSNITYGLKACSRKPASPLDFSGNLEHATFANKPTIV